MEEVMDWNRVQGSWKQLEGKVKAKTLSGTPAEQDPFCEHPEAR
jgi:hypothetical protein